MKKFIQPIIDFLRKHLSPEVVTLLISFVPLIELRGAIPIGMALGLPYLKSVVVSFLGSSIPPIFIVYFIGHIFNILRKLKFMDRLITKIEEKTIKKKDQIEKYGYIGLMLFVGIPLPGTGAWSGSLLAYLLKLDKKKSLIAITAGNLLAAIIIFAVSGTLFSIF